jgi:hypothetical protein
MAAMQTEAIAGAHLPLLNQSNIDLYKSPHSTGDSDYSLATETKE